MNLKESFEWLLEEKNVFVSDMITIEHNENLIIITSESNLPLITPNKKRAVFNNPVNAYRYLDDSSLLILDIKKIVENEVFNRLRDFTSEVEPEILMSMIIYRSIFTQENPDSFDVWYSDEVNSMNLHNTLIKRRHLRFYQEDDGKVILINDLYIQAFMKNYNINSHCKPLRYRLPNWVIYTEYIKLCKQTTASVDVNDTDEVLLWFNKKFVNWDENVTRVRTYLLEASTEKLMDFIEKFLYIQFKIESMQ